jgi:PAS domain S-box-containing protein
MATSSARTPQIYNPKVAIAPYETLSRALEQAEERFQQLTQRIAAGVFRASAKGHLVEVNPALVRMLGYSSESDLLGLEMQRSLFADPLDCERLRAQLVRVTVERAPIRCRRKDGTCISVRLSMRTVYDERAGEMWYDGIVDDVTDRVRQQELMRRTERMAGLGATLAGVAHELNNPLAAILGFAQLLLKNETNPESRRALETIDHEASRAGKIVRDLLTLARKRETERRVRVSLNEIVGYIVGTRRYALETHGVSCTTTLDTDLPFVLGDRTQLEQVVLNLLNNAEQAIRAAGSDQGRVHIRTRAEKSMAVLEIEDDGPGIRSEDRERIWDAFWTTKSAGVGTGLGLSVVRDIVSSHGGEIDAEDVVAAQQRRGARFVVRLPGVHYRGDGSDVLPERACRALDVLVVDADAKNASFLTTFLASRGHAALTVHDVEYAAHLANHLTFDAVICDAGVARAGSALGGLRAATGCAGARFIVAAGDPETTARLPVPLPTAMSLVMRPYDLEELRILLED